MIAEFVGLPVFWKACQILMAQNPFGAIHSSDLWRAFDAAITAQNRKNYPNREANLPNMANSANNGNEIGAEEINVEEVMGHWVQTSCTLKTLSILGNTFLSILPELTLVSHYISSIGGKSYV